MCQALVTVSDRGLVGCYNFPPFEVHLATPSHVYVVAAHTNSMGFKLGPSE